MPLRLNGIGQGGRGLVDLAQLSPVEIPEALGNRGCLRLARLGQPLLGLCQTGVEDGDLLPQQLLPTLDIRCRLDLLAGQQLSASASAAGRPSRSAGAGIEAGMSAIRRN